MRLSRPFAVAALALVAASGCHWFHKPDKAYRESAESRPLEVPPDLDRPNTEGAMAPAEAPRSVMRSDLTAPVAANPSGFTVQGERDAVFAKVGDALAGMQGVTIASKAQLLGTYDVSYEGANFLVRVTAVTAGVYVSAIDPRGTPATEAAPLKLIAALKGALGG
ncbi:MAG TPA: hypothetical protein VLM17_06780 [Xanthomonadaceae bacterium]|nr:hypothetical protein [Xanthomonadaceae bacterium]